ncbi:MAG: 3-deoxy-manno-octulosonate cytidylyltransferase [Chlamydiota bacterium]
MGQVIGILPARYQSTRFPGKMLYKIRGKSLIQHSYENAKKSSLDDVIVATDDLRIMDHVKEFGGKAIMTSVSCANGTERLAEAVSHHLHLQKADVIVNIQGDHPCISSQTIEAAVKVLLEGKEAVMSTAAALFEDPTEAISPHVVKCVFDRNHNALYFSRSLIPYLKNPTKNLYYHVGIYAYRPEFLLIYPTLQNTNLQLSEDLEQLKVLEYGYRIKVAIVQEKVLGVDIPEDIQKIEKFLCR